MSIPNFAIGLNSEPFFFGRLPRAECERKLLSHGDYLVRESESSAGSYTLGFRDGDRVVNYRLHPVAGGMVAISPEAQDTFPTISLLIDHFRGANLLPLLTPVVSPTYKQQYTQMHFEPAANGGRGGLRMVPEPTTAQISVSQEPQYTPMSTDGSLRFVPHSTPAPRKPQPEYTPMSSRSSRQGSSHSPSRAAPPPPPSRYNANRQPEIPPRPHNSSSGSASSWSQDSKIAQFSSSSKTDAPSPLISNIASTAGGGPSWRQNWKASKIEAYPNAKPASISNQEEDLYVQPSALSSPSSQRPSRDSTRAPTLQPKPKWLGGRQNEFAINSAATPRRKKSKAKNMGATDNVRHVPNTFSHELSLSPAMTKRMKAADEAKKIARANRKMEKGGGIVSEGMKFQELISFLDIGQPEDPVRSS